MKNLIGNIYHYNRSGGFSLLEMIVAVGIFSVVALISTSVILSLNTVQKKVLNVQNTHDNIRFALESMARDIRTGENYIGGCDWPAGCNMFSFQRSTSGELVTYRLNGGVIERQESTGPWFPITDPQRTITRLRFYTTGIGAFVEQEKITIVIEVESGIPTRQAEYASLQLQTTVTKRSIFPSL